MAEQQLNKFTLQPPVPIKPWFGIRTASEMGQKCIQGGSPKSMPVEWPNIDIEDCLNLNIFTPALPPHRRTNSADFPVLFYVHGGSFSTGSNAEHPAAYMLEHKIVLVVPNYRLDALGKSQTNANFHTDRVMYYIKTPMKSAFFVFNAGFLSTKTVDIPGNAGMLDILLALKWVKNYIKYFGGNPNKITVAGKCNTLANLI